MNDEFLTPQQSNDHCLCPPAYSKFTNIRKAPLVAVVHVGAVNCVFTVYTAPDLKFLLRAEQELHTLQPQPGWYEQNAEEIIEAVHRCCYNGCKMLPSHGYVRSDIEALGITNERDTVVAWDERNGLPLHSAILANDKRTLNLTEKIISKLPNNDFNYFKSINGMPVLPQLAALKMRWLQENVPEVKAATHSGHCKFGTLDSWVVWKLTKGALYVTDVSNASRTLLMNIATLSWDEQLLQAFSIKPGSLPIIRSCAENFGIITAPQNALSGTRIGGIITNQSAAVLGQMCMHRGQTTANFDGSLNMLSNIGKKRVHTRELSTCVVYKLGANAPSTYALEGSVPYSGDALNWLKHNVRVMPNVEDVQLYAEQVDDTNDVVFVPAMSGLHAPYWRRDARGIIIGLTETTTRAHIARAALEAICFQVCDIIEALKLSGEYYQNVIYACGVNASKTLLMQMLANITGATVVYYGGTDAVSYGAAICAGSAMDAVDLQRFEQSIWRMSIDFQTFVPTTRNEQRTLNYINWRRAVGRTLRWVPTEKRSALWQRCKNFLLFGSLFSGALITALVVAFKRGKSSALVS